MASARGLMRAGLSPPGDPAACSWFDIRPPPRNDIPYRLEATIERASAIVYSRNGMTKRFHTFFTIKEVETPLIVVLPGAMTI